MVTDPSTAGRAVMDMFWRSPQCKPLLLPGLIQRVWERSGAQRRRQEHWSKGRGFSGDRRKFLGKYFGYLTTDMTRAV